MTSRLEVARALIDELGLGEQVAHKVLAVSIIAGLGNLPGGLVVGAGPGCPGDDRCW
jgi:branched-subunit amino acid ABC-type transport system permease component